MDKILTKTRTIILQTLKISKFSICCNVSTKSIQNPSLILKRSMFQWNRKLSPEKYKIMDKIPQGYELIYRCTMDSYLIGTQIVCSLSLLVAAVMAVIDYDKNKKYEMPDYIIEDFKLMNEKHQMIFFTVGFILLNITALFVVTRLPLRIYINEQAKAYLAIICGHIPNQKSLVAFKVGEICKKGFFISPWKEHTYKIKNGRSIVLLDQYFRRPYDMNVMLGYNKL